MRGATDSAGSEGTGLAVMSPPQPPVVQRAERNQTHRGLPTELLREIVLYTFGSYFPELCINPEFDMSWDPILSLLHSSNLLRSIVINILEHALGDVFIDEHTKVLQNYKPAMKELHQVAVILAKEPLDSFLSHPVFIVMTRYHVDCPVSWRARLFHIEYEPLRGDNPSHGNRRPPGWLEMTAKEIEVHPLRLKVPLYIKHGILYPIDRVSALHVSPADLATWLGRMCKAFRNFDPWIHHNSASLVTKIRPDMKITSQTLRVVCTFQVKLRNDLLLGYVLNEEGLPRLSEAQMRECGIHDALSTLRRPTGVQDNDARVAFCKQNREILLYIVAEEEPLLGLSPVEAAGVPDTSNMMYNIGLL
ncbi:hypothetical protein EVG20_g4619 [Dentipellis fragilis]|uniref:Uncharacterized protein n=1 Tax=Dentipellis fragilis TaxID=205917 RepID=A0A4Y9YVM2_9AGAM|nr:hypothetical protein EVG20_g4619 [Dentipellis fragilis]